MRVIPHVVAITGQFLSSDSIPHAIMCMLPKRISQNQSRAPLNHMSKSELLSTTVGELCTHYFHLQKLHQLHLSRILILQIKLLTKEKSSPVYYFLTTCRWPECMYMCDIIYSVVLGLNAMNCRQCPVMKINIINRCG